MFQDLNSSAEYVLAACRRPTWIKSHDDSGVLAYGNGWARRDLGPVVGCTVVGEDSRPEKGQRRADLSGLLETYATGRSLLHTC